MKLHLGCGQVYLDGYVNIDYPLTKHTLQEKSVADKFTDLQELNYQTKTVEEIRNHHVFEHFPRHVALALFASWYVWLKRGGTIHIEVPDFEESTRLIFNSNSLQQEKCVALRHIFGSNEASWAVHYDGWTEERLKELAKIFGYKNIKIAKSSYLSTRNVTLTAKKGTTSLNKKKIMSLAQKYLSNYILNESPFETKLLNIWLKEFESQFDKSTAYGK